MNSCKAYAVVSLKSELKPIVIQRRAVGPSDVAISIKYAGICHSDIHTVREEWGPISYPLAPGHEIGFLHSHFYHFCTTL